MFLTPCIKTEKPWVVRMINQPGAALIPKRRINFASRLSPFVRADWELRGHSLEA